MSCLIYGNFCFRKVCQPKLIANLNCVHQSSSDLLLALGGPEWTRTTGVSSVTGLQPATLAARLLTQIFCFSIFATTEKPEGFQSYTPTTSWCTRWDSNPQANQAQHPQCCAYSNSATSAYFFCYSILFYSMPRHCQLVCIATPYYYSSPQTILPTMQQTKIQPSRWSFELPVNWSASLSTQFKCVCPYATVKQTTAYTAL